MRTFIKAAFCALIMFAGASAARAQVSVSVGIAIGQPPPPRVVRVVPRSPGPGYFWVAGYWYPVGRRYVWHPGYWSRPPYDGAVWVAPRYDRGRYFVGYWNGPRGRVDHDHRWDHDRGRDYEGWRRDRDHRDHHDRDRRHRHHDDHDH